MAASRRRFFLLDEVVPASEVPDTMGRVVQDIFLPLRRYAPPKPVDGTAPTCRPRDILPNILPEPTFATSRKAVLEGLPTKELHIALTDLFGLDLARGHSDAAEIEGKDVKQYSLNQSKDVFEYLMRDEAYAAGVRKLLQDSPKKRAYFITGFITTSSATIKRKSGRKVEHGFTIGLPLSSAFGVPSFLDPKIAPTVSHEISTSQESILSDDCIFAIAYDVIALKKVFDAKTPAFVRRSVEHQGMKRAKPQHLAMGKYDDSDEEIGDEDDDDENYEEANSQAELVSLDKSSSDAVEWVAELEDPQSRSASSPSHELAA